jgi:hypothetical protein
VTLVAALTNCDDPVVCDWALSKGIERRSGVDHYEIVKLCRVTPPACRGNPFTVWNGAAVQQPQRVRFFYGYIVEARGIPVVYETPARFVSNWEPQGRELIPITQQYPASTPTERPFGYEDPCPGRVCQGVEYTVMLDKSTTPPDEFLQLGQRPAIIVVQNIAQTQAALPQGRHSLSASQFSVLLGTPVLAMVETRRATADPDRRWSA